MPHTRLFKISFFSIILCYLLSFAYFERWETGIIGGGDGFGYNAYLPALFIHGDLDKLTTTFATKKKYHPGFGASASNPLGTDVAQHLGDGKQIIKYTAGVAILQAPFFFLGHITAYLSDYPMDGYSPPYIVWEHLATFFYVFLGLWFLMKVLREYFTERTLIFVLFALTLATNLYYFTVYNSPMSHGFLFGLYGLLIYGTVYFYKRPNWKMAVLIGLAAGMITLIRPVEIFCLFIPLLYGIKSIKNRLSFLVKHKALFFLAGLVYAVPGCIQLAYWKSISGNWLFYSYGEEGFDFKHPQIWSGLTSFHNGWLIYTPIMALAGFGVLYLFKKRDWLWAILSFMPIHIYIAYSWWCWYYINGFGSRPMVETYALLSIPLGYAFFVLQKKAIGKYVLLAIIGAFSVLNIFQTYQLSKGVMWSEMVSRAYYFSTFGKTSLNYHDLIHFESNETQPDTNEYKKIKQLHFDNFEDSLDVNYQNTIVHKGNFTYKLTKEKVYAPGLADKLASLEIQTGDYIRISAWCFKEIKESSWWSMALMVGYVARDEKPTQFTQIWVGNKLKNDNLSLWGGQAGVWDEVVFFVKIQDTAKQTDTFKAFIQNSNAHPLYIDDFKVELWRER